MCNTFEASADNQNQENSAPHVLNQRKLNRRMFLGLGAATVATAVFAPERLIQAADIPPAKPQESQSADAPPARNHEIRAPFKTESIMERDSLRLYLDDDGFPVSYQLNFGELQAFTEEEIERMKSAQKKAAESGEAEVATQIIEYLPIQHNQFSEERPLVTVPPERTLTPEQLAARNVEIINPNDPKANKLFLTDEIFQSSGLLGPLVLLNEQLPEDERQKLTLAVINGGALTQEYATAQEYDRVRHKLDEMKKTVQQLVTQHQRDLTTSLELNREWVKKDPRTELFQDRVLRYKSLITLYTQTLSEAELLMEMYFKEKKNRAAGQYFQYPFDENRKESVIFIAAPELKQTLNKTYYSIMARPEGDFGIYTLKGTEINDAPAPRVDQGFPSPDDATQVTNKDFTQSELTAEQAEEKKVSVYRYAFQTGGNLRHEFAHYILMNILPKLAEKGVIDQSELYKKLIENEEIKKYLIPWGLSDGYFPMMNNEAVTDQLAYDTLAAAWKKWEESGFTDPSGFYIVFQIPYSDVLQGGYQLTNTQNDTSQQLIAA